MVNPLWFHHFVGFFWSCLDAFISSIGTTLLGVLSGLLFTASSIVASLIRIRRRHGAEAMVKAWKEDGKTALRTTIFVGLIIYGPIFLYTVVATIYHDHQSLVARNRELRHSVQPLTNEVADLKKRLTETCYMPDRRLTQSQHDVLYNALEKIAGKYHHPHLDVGYFDGDMESLRYWYPIYMLFKDAGFIVPTPPDKAIHRRQRQKPSDSPDYGYKEGLSIQTVTIPGNQQPIRNQIAVDIAQAFNDAGVPMQTYNVGQGTAVPVAPGELIVWVGIKKIDWLESTKRWQGEK